ncbi:hypothetical protein B0H11DRAFT_1966516 [Mycena galericulata]|nr:hypothetical protein B0H11DRAFT_1966516 [Mycena galericulata]
MSPTRSWPTGKPNISTSQMSVLLGSPFPSAYQAGSFPSTAWSTRTTEPSAVASPTRLVMFWLWPQAKKPWLFGLALACSGFGWGWLWPGLGFIQAKAKFKLISLPKAMAQAKPSQSQAKAKVWPWPGLRFSEAKPKPKSQSQSQNITIPDPRVPLNTLLPFVVPIPPRLPTAASLATSMSLSISRYFFTPLPVHDDDSYTLGNEKRKLDETEYARPRGPAPHHRPNFTALGARKK